MSLPGLGTHCGLVWSELCTQACYPGLVGSRPITNYRYCITKMYHGNGIHFTSQRLVATSAHCMSETLDKLQIVHSCTTPNNETDGRVGQIMVDIGNRARNKPSAKFSRPSPGWKRLALSHLRLKNRDLLRYCIRQRFVFTALLGNNTRRLLEEDIQHNMFQIDKVILPDDQCPLNNFRNRSCNDFALLYLDRKMAFTYDDLHYGHGG